MRKARIQFASFFVVICCQFLLLFSLQAETLREYIAIRKEGAGKISIMIDQCKAVGVTESVWAKKMDETINGALHFIGLFNLLPVPLTSMTVSNGTQNTIDIGSTGADVFISGTLSQVSGMVVLGIQVRDVTGKQLLSRRYSGQESNLRQIGLRFSADLVELLTGKRSVFHSKIAFVSNRTGKKEIYQCDFDGQNIRQLTALRSIALTPAFSIDGRYLAWTDYSSGRPDLYIRNMVSNTTVSVKKQGVCISPAWRPGSTECATTLSHEGDQDIYLIRVDGSVDRRLTRTQGIDVSPTFSPDGSKMAFVSTREGSPQIFIQNLDDGEVQRLTYSGNYNTQPAWSPSGDKILFSSLQKNGEINIFEVNTDGSGVMQLTRASGNNEYPSWSPDSSMIVFSSNRQGQRKLYVMNADGSGQRPLLDMEGEEQQPSWSSIR
ncbi:MAG: Tol-Pal system beta propeller repeat protein TolB [Chlorobiaceae bacterium]|nr:Tol-Pal system beta propeller repeat protein TolB [Chlorobiaceae bacterium]